MAEHGVLLAAGEAARRLGIGASTLRIYSVKLAELLSMAAGQPAARPGGRPGVRRYTEGDLRILERGRQLLAGGRTYEQVVGDLRGRRSEGEGGQRVTAVPRQERQGGASEMAGLLEALKVAVERAAMATEAWRLLAEERGREVGELRERERLLREELATLRTRGSWWSRLWGRD